jgi:hypothetical protein
MSMKGKEGIIEDWKSVQGGQGREFQFAHLGCCFVQEALAREVTT